MVKLCKCGCGEIVPPGLVPFFSPACKYRAEKAKKKAKNPINISSVTDATVIALWSKLVKLRDKRCVYCGSVDGLAAHHIISRGNASLRYWLPNGITLCKQHHTGSSVFSAHLTPAQFMKWVKLKRGHYAITNLIRLANIVKMLDLDKAYEILKSQEGVYSAK